jgi:hypothetical protein
MGKKAEFVLHVEGEPPSEIVGTARQAARAATRQARGTFVRAKSMWEQPEGAAPGRRVVLKDARGRVVMRCEPTIYGIRSKRSSRAFALCDLTPAFRRRLAPRRGGRSSR